MIDHLPEVREEDGRVGVKHGEPVESSTDAAVPLEVLHEEVGSRARVMLENQVPNLGCGDNGGKKSQPQQTQATKQGSRDSLDITTALAHRCSCCQ